MQDPGLRAAMRKPIPKDPDLPNGKLAQWNGRVAIVAYAKFVAYPGSCVLNIANVLKVTNGGLYRLLTPGDLPDWARRQSTEARAVTLSQLSTVVSRARIVLGSSAKRLTAPRNQPTLVVDSRSMGFTRLASPRRREQGGATRFIVRAPLPDADQLYHSHASRHHCVRSSAV